MNGPSGRERVHTIIVGGGQAGLSVGYQLARRGLPFVILDANERIGDSWRKRWDSLRLFTPARFDGLAGMPFPAPAHSFPTKDEMADYLEAYAARFELPVRTGVRVDGLSRRDGRYVVSAGDEQLRGRPRGRGDGDLPESPGTPVRGRARSRHRPAPFERVPEPVPASRGRRARRRSGQLGRGDRARGCACRASDVAVGTGRGPHPVPHRGTRGAGLCWRGWCSGSSSTAC